MQGLTFATDIYASLTEPLGIGTHLTLHVTLVTTEKARNVLVLPLLIIVATFAKPSKLWSVTGKDNLAQITLPIPLCKLACFTRHCTDCVSACIAKRDLPSTFLPNLAVTFRSIRNLRCARKTSKLWSTVCGLRNVLFVARKTEAQFPRKLQCSFF